MEGRITFGHWFSGRIIAAGWRYVLLAWVAALVMVSASPTLMAEGNYDQPSGSGEAMSPQESGSPPVAAPFLDDGPKSGGYCPRPIIQERSRLALAHLKPF